MGYGNSRPLLTIFWGRRGRMVPVQSVPIAT